MIASSLLPTDLLLKRNLLTHSKRELHSNYTTAQARPRRAWERRWWCGAARQASWAPEPTQSPSGTLAAPAFGRQGSSRVAGTDHDNGRDAASRDADTPYRRAALLDRANGSGALSTSGFSSARAGKPEALLAPSCCCGKASVLILPAQSQSSIAAVLQTRKRGPLLPADHSVESAQQHVS